MEIEFKKLRRTHIVQIFIPFQIMSIHRQKFHSYCLNMKKILLALCVRLRYNNDKFIKYLFC